MNLNKYLANLIGWRTNYKIVVIESDDWGSIRMPSINVLSELKKKGINVISGDNERFNSLDTIESKEDFELLFQTLSNYRDQSGKHPIITALSLTANPDFEKIASANFKDYFFETVPITLQKYGRSGAWEMYQIGEKEKLFYPEFHGREHLNVRVWLQSLQKKDFATTEAFSLGFWGFKSQNKWNISYQAAFDVDELKTLDFQKEIIKSGIKLFEQIYNRKPKYFVPPNGSIHQDIINTAVLEGIEYVSSPKIFREPQGNGKTKMRFRYLGKIGYNGMRYLTRNCFFEPSYKGKGFSENDCLAQINTAFSLNKPAIISTHRVNYIGGLNSQNAISGNKSLNNLLSNILRKWPDVEFMTSTQLGNLIKNDKK